MVRCLRVLAVIVMLTSVACYGACEGMFGSGPTPLPAGSPAPTPTATPTPITVDSSCTATCRVHSIVIDEGISVIPMGETQTYNMTPFTEVSICDANGKPTAFTKLVKTTSDCDEPRAGAVSWVASSNALEVTNLGFKATVKRKATGDTVLTVSLEGRPYSRIIR